MRGGGGEETRALREEGEGRDKREEKTAGGKKKLRGGDCKLVQRREQARPGKMAWEQAAERARTAGGRVCCSIDDALARAGRSEWAGRRRKRLTR